MISQGTGPISKVTSEDTLTTWTASELNATDSDTNASQLSWSVLTPPSNGTAQSMGMVHPLKHLLIYPMPIFTDPILLQLWYQMVTKTIPLQSTSP